MTVVITKRRIFLAGMSLFVIIWAAAYFLWPKFSFDDGPFFADPFAADLGVLLPVSSIDLSLFGARLLVLETLATREPDPRTVFILKNASNDIRWAKVASADFGRIEIIGRPPRWFIAGGWVVAIKPEKTEGGELYLSPFGEFRFFFHSW
jgi:hypothetical protein